MPGIALSGHGFRQVDTRYELPTSTASGSMDFERVHQDAFLTDLMLRHSEFLQYDMILGLLELPASPAAEGSQAASRASSARAEIETRKVAL